MVVGFFFMISLLVEKEGCMSVHGVCTMGGGGGKRGRFSLLFPSFNHFSHVTKIIYYGF